MTKYGLRARVLAFTILPTLLIGSMLAVYFTAHRHQQIEDLILDQGMSIIEPLAIASEYGMAANSREYLKRIIGLSHRKNSPFVKSIAVFTRDNELVVTSNYHRDFAMLRLPEGKPIPELTSIEYAGDYIILRTPILAETRLSDTQLLRNDPPQVVGYLSMQLNTDRMQILHYRDTAVAMLAVLVGLALSLYFGLNLVNVVIDPINRMVRAVYQIREGRLDTRVRGMMNGELDMLKNGINAMAKAIAEYHNEMQQNIDQATADLRETLEQIEIQNVELDLAKKRAQEAARVKSEFLANMSHELRTPLNGVIGFAKQLQKTPLSANQSDYLNTIEKSAKNLLNIINDILDFSKLEAGKLQLEQLLFSLRDMVDETMTLLAPSAHEKGLELSVRIDTQVPDLLSGDPLRLQQVLTNLIGNAIKFTEQGNVDVHIGLLASNEPDRVRLCTRIRDTGIGMTSRQQAQLFQPFNQGDSSISRRYGGTGLGLIITQKLVQQMDGSIEVHSLLDQGSEFIFNVSLPLATQSQEPSEGTRPLAGIHGVLIESDAWARAACDAQLQEWGMTVTALPGFEQAGALQTVSPPLLLLGLPARPDPATLAQQLTQLPWRYERLILLLSSHDPDVIDALRPLDASQCLSKPVPHRRLLNALLSPGEPSPSPASPVPSHPHWPLKVLAVDDNPANLKLICAMLEDLVSEVHSCQNGRQAVELAQRSSFDIIFMDIQMPVLDGISATRHIREEGCNQQTPIVAVTAHAIPGERERLMSLGMDEYLSKPIDEEQLEALLRKLTLVGQILPEQQLIDWPLALRQSGSKPQLAREMLQLLLQTCDEVEPLLVESLRDEGDDEDLLVGIHKLCGGCAYCGVPRLQRLCTELETALRHEVPGKQLEPELLEMTDLLAQLRREAPRWLVPLVS